MENLERGTEVMEDSKKDAGIIDVEALLDAVEARTLKAFKDELDRRDAVALAKQAEEDAHWTARWAELNAEFKAGIEAAQASVEPPMEVVGRPITAGIIDEAKKINEVHRMGYGLHNALDEAGAWVEKEQTLSWWDRLLIRYNGWTVLAGAAIGAVYFAIAH